MTPTNLFSQSDDTQSTYSKNENTIVAKALYEELAFEITNRPLDFYLYLIPAAIIPYFTTFLPQPVKAYTDIVIITVYVSAVYKIAR